MKEFPLAPEDPAPRPRGGQGGRQRGQATRWGGFNAAMAALVDRKLRELGGRWKEKDEYFRRAEARRRAHREMANRIEKHTGKRYAVSTLARKASGDHTPAKVDSRWLLRWSQIDRAGGMKALADKRGRTVKQVAAWRDRKGPRRYGPSREAGRGPEGPRDWLAGGGDVTIGVQTDGLINANGEQYDKSLPTGGEEYEWLTADEEMAMDIRDAWNNQDTDTVASILDELITFQVLPEWPNLPPDAFYTTTETKDLVFDEDLEDL